MSAIGESFTFEGAKRMPRHGWLYYKEGFSPYLVDYLLAKEEKKGLLYDPFCGVGTSLVEAKIRGWHAVGLDISPLAVLASRVKTRNYSPEFLREAMHLAREVGAFRDEMARWEFELFPPSRAFPEKNYREICFIRAGIDALAQEERMRDFLLLALVAILPHCSWLVKDGGVLRLVPGRKRHLPRARQMFLRKVEQMVREAPIVGNEGEEPEVVLEDAKAVVLEEPADVVITSPPYLNNVDYSKIYGLELSLLTLRRDSTVRMRRKAVESFIFSSEGAPLPKALEDLNEPAFRHPVVTHYLADLAKVMENLVRSTADHANIYVVIGDAFLFSIFIPVAQYLIEIGEALGLEGRILETKWRLVSFSGQKMGKCGEHLIWFKKE